MAIKTRFLFEFCDHPRTPRSVRLTLLELLHFCNRNLRGYYRQVSEQILADCDSHGLKTVVELGAGTAPITTELAADPAAAGITLIPCDLYPEQRVWEKLRRENGDRVQPIHEAVDFMVARAWPEQVAFVLVAAFHHIAPQDRSKFLEQWCQPGNSVLVFEPLRKTYLSMFLTLFAFFPALLLPIGMMTEPGTLRRMLWCWLLPIVPLMFLWDGWVSCLRQWSLCQWESQLRSRLPADAEWKIGSGPHSHWVTWHWPTTSSSPNCRKQNYESR